MNKPETFKDTERDDKALLKREENKPEHAPETEREAVVRHPGRRWLGLMALLLLVGAVSYGAWQHSVRAKEVADVAEEHRDFVPNVLVAPVKASNPTMSVSWPATTDAYPTANIYGRTSGHASERNVDI